MSNRRMMYDAAVAHAKGHIEKHKANVEIYFNQSVGIGEHGDICLLYTSDAADE